MKKVEAAKSQPEKAAVTTWPDSRGYSANPYLFGNTKPAGAVEPAKKETVSANYSYGNGTI